jgi:hypothetical protein
MKEIKARSVWPWSFLWRNTAAYYRFYDTPIGVLTVGEAQRAVKKISANAKYLATVGIIVNKHRTERGVKSSEFKI